MRAGGAVGLCEARSNSLNEGFHQKRTCADYRSQDRESACLPWVTKIVVSATKLYAKC